MITKPFPGANKPLSMLGMGLMRLPTVGGDPNASIDYAKAEEIIRYLYEHGVNYFDAAFRYMRGEAEPFAGEVLQQFPRDSYYLASKLPGHMMHYKDGKLGFHGYLSGYQAGSATAIFEEQLERCKTDYFDFYLLHNVNESSVELYLNPEADIVGQLLKQKEMGRIKHFGISTHGSVEMIDHFLTHYEGKFEFVQIQFNYLDARLQRAKEKYDVIVKHGLPVWTMESTRGGRLTKLPPDAEAILRAVHPEDSMAKWAFRYLQSMPHVQVVLSGMNTLTQAEENANTFSELQPLTKEEMEALEKVVDIMLNLVPCTGCRYCTEECPMELDIPSLMMAYNEVTNAGSTPWFILNTDDPAHQPERCVGCGSCQAICPQGIHIPEIMPELAEKLATGNYPWRERS